MIITLEGEEAKAYLEYLASKTPKIKLPPIMDTEPRERHRVISDEVAKAADIASEVAQPEIDTTPVEAFPEKPYRKPSHRWTPTEVRTVLGCINSTSPSHHTLQYIYDRFDRGTMDMAVLANKIRHMGYSIIKGVVYAK